jgi:hypothetical protein
MRKAFTILFGVALLGCDEITTGEDPTLLELPVPEQTFGSPAVSSRSLARVDTQFLAVPTRVRAGTALEFTLPVASGGCLYGDTTVTRVSGKRVSIWPYQVLALNAVCAAIYRVESRPISVVLPESGEVQLQIVTRNGPDGKFVVLERRVTVE